MEMRSMYRKPIEQLYAGGKKTSRPSTRGPIHIDSRQAGKPSSVLPIELELPLPDKTATHGCARYVYPLNDILETDYSKISSNVKYIFVAIYRISVCTQPNDTTMPLLEYMLYKYPPSDSSAANLCLFPFIKRKGSKNSRITDQGDKLFKRVTGEGGVANQGFIESNNAVYIFYHLTKSDQEVRFRPRLLDAKTELWWCIIDEICNHKSLLHFPIHISVYKLFYRFPKLIHLRGPKGLIDIPMVVYWANSMQLVPIVAVLGQHAAFTLREDPPAEITKLYGQYYYASLNRALRYVFERPGVGGDAAEGRGLIRLALFTGRPCVYCQTKVYRVWAKDYNSWIKASTHNGIVGASYAVPTYYQRIPLSIHMVDIVST